MTEDARRTWIRKRLPSLIGAAPLLALVLSGLWSLWKMSRLANVHWDEFYYLSKVYAHLGDRMTVALQSFHVHLFSWLRFVSDNEVDQILAARGVMLLFGLITLGSMFAIAYRLTRSLVASLFPIVVLLGFRDILVHFHSFRADPMLVCLWLSSAALMAWGVHRRGFQIATGALLGLAMAISIKTIFFLPTAAVAVLFPLGDESGREVLKRAMRVGLAFTATWTTLMILHYLSLSSASADDSVGLLSSAAEKAFTAFPFFPRMVYLARYLEWDFFVFLYVALGVVAAAVSLGAGGEERRSSALVAACVLPMLSLVVYRNAWPYYYVCLIPPAAVVSSALIWRIERLSRSSPLVAGVVAALLAIPLVHTHVTFMRRHAVDEVSQQRAVVDTVKMLFPEPVPYIDRCGMVSSYPMAGFFMSTWTLGAYRESGKPVMKDILRRSQPRFLLANLATIDPGRAGGKKRNRGHRLLEEDHAVLRRNFVRHIGPIWVAGKRLQLEADDEIEFEVWLEGPYTIEGRPMVEIDGLIHAPGDVVYLDERSYRLRVVEGRPGKQRRGKSRKAEVVLRYGEDLPEVELPDTKRLFRDGPHPRK